MYFHINRQTCSSVFIGQLNLQIPWKNLYTQPVEAVLDGVYLLIVPTASIKYDAEKEEKQQLEAKQRELQRIEDAKQKIADKDKPQERQDTFIEKLITQITNKDLPLSFGVSLQNLSLQNNLKHGVASSNTIPDGYNFVFRPISAKAKLRMNPRSDVDFSAPKLDLDVNLQDIAIELNKPQYFSIMELLESIDMMTRNLPYRKYRPAVPVHNNAKEWWLYIIHGILEVNVQPKLQMWSWEHIRYHRNRVKSYKDLYKTKITSKKPAEDSMNILEELEKTLDIFNITLARQQAEFEVAGFMMEWEYILHSETANVQCVSEYLKGKMTKWLVHLYDEEAPALNNLQPFLASLRTLFKDWFQQGKAHNHLMTLKQGTELITQYTKEFWQLAANGSLIGGYEDPLLLRWDATKAGLKIFRPGAKQDVEESSGWFGWMWGWGGKKSPESVQEPKGFEQLMTPQEKDKLYAAIGYSETAVDPTLPKTYEAMKLYVKLLSMTILIRENKEKPALIEIALIDLRTTVTQRPGAEAIRFESSVSAFEVQGMTQGKTVPCLLSSNTVHSKHNTSLFTIMFETNPLDESANQKLRIESQPLEIIYDAMTVNSLVDFFRPPSNVHLEQLTSATLTKLEEFREKTATGLVYVIETQKVLDLKINLMASYVIVPQNGFYESTANKLLLDLGHLKMTSKSRSTLQDIKVGESALEDIMSRAYDKFDIQLSSIQLLYSRHDESWEKARSLRSSSQHILQPLDVKMELSRAMVVTDVRMPKYKIFGELPLLSFNISDEKLKCILELIDSIPKPESPPDISAPQPSKASLWVGLDGLCGLF
ncbi:hypothetical protein JD844_009143 [Phrynosoma platyrhinos]|uniref:Chorein N-terminal domain-containing protein n=1 Tax=Phrynosoma platyrhinos TaxID=52577 RepID=A0ABQ7TF35_PHRPL|nr:hypothetical protein JD844_009143 [Phrynosoma platyrhinos]